MDDTAYVFSQVFTIIMYALLMVTYFVKNKRTIIVASTIAIFMNILAYVLLGAWSGLAVCGIALVRNLYSLWDEKKHGKKKKQTMKDYIVLAIVFIAMAIAAYFTYEGPLSLMSVFASAIYAYSIWQRNVTVYKLCGIPVGILWIIYNTFVRSIFGVILETVLLVTAIIGLISDPKSKKKTKKLSKKSSKKIK